MSQQVHAGNSSFSTGVDLSTLHCQQVLNGSPPARGALELDAQPAL